MSLIGKFSTCSVCGKRRIIAKQLNKVLNKQNSVDIYLECKDCAALPLWDTKARNQKVFDHYQWTSNLKKLESIGATLDLEKLQYV